MMKKCMKHENMTICWLSTIQNVGHFIYIIKKCLDIFYLFQQIFFYDLFFKFECVFFRLKIKDVAYSHCTQAVLSLGRLSLTKVVSPPGPCADWRSRTNLCREMRPADWKNNSDQTCISDLSVLSVSLDIVGAQLRAPLKPPNTSQHYCIEGFKRGP